MSVLQLQVLTQLALSLAIVGASIPVFTYMHLKVSPICGTLSWAVFWAVSLGVASFVLSNALVVYYQDKYGMFGTEFPSEPAKADNIWKLLVRFTVPSRAAGVVIITMVYLWYCRCFLASPPLVSLHVSRLFQSTRSPQLYSLCCTRSPFPLDWSHLAGSCSRYKCCQHLDC